MPILHGGGDPYPDPMALLVFFLTFYASVHTFAMLIVFNVIDIFTSFTFVCSCVCSHFVFFCAGLHTFHASTVS